MQNILVRMDIFHILALAISPKNMTITQRTQNEWHIKEGRRIKFRVYKLRNGKFQGTTKCGFGIASGDTLQECIARTTAQDERNRQDFKNRLVSLS